MWYYAQVQKKNLVHQQNVKNSLVEVLENTKKEPNNSSEKIESFKKEFCDYLNSAPYFFGIHPEFLELFPAEENFDFWYSIATGGNSQIDYRHFKVVLYEEIIRNNDNETGDRLFGIGYTSNFPYSEQDFVSQNIWFGYLGTILLIGPYFLLFAYGIILALIKIKKCFIYQNAFFALFFAASVLLSFMAGHLFYGIFSITVFAFMSAYFFKFQTERYRT